MSSKSRYELKFVLNEISFVKFASYLFGVSGFRRSFEQRRINSLYFDDLQFSSVRDNLSGNSKRSKVRLRWYGELQSSHNSFVLEQKIRKNREGSKNILTLDGLQFGKNTPVSLLKSIIEKNHSACCCITSNLFPSLYVGYERKYFHNSSGVRLTVDQGITYRALLLSGQILEKQPSISHGKKVLELKFAPDQKEEVARLLRRTNCTPVRHSKYVVGLAMHGMVNYV